MSLNGNAVMKTRMIYSDNYEKGISENIRRYGYKKLCRYLMYSNINH